MITLPPFGPSTRLLLHGDAGLAPERAFIDALGGDVIAPSCPGFAGEPLPVWLRSVDQLSYHYLDALEAAAPAPVVAIGVSFGAWLLLEMATKQPQLFAALVLVAPVGVKLNGREHAQFADLFAIGIEDQFAALYADPAVALKRLRAAADDELTAIATAQEALARFTWEPYLHNPLLRHRLHRIRCSTLVVHGVEDRLIADPDYYRRFAALFASPLTVTGIAGAGHRVEEEQPAAVAEQVRRFLQAQG